MTDVDSARVEGYARRRKGDLAGAAEAFATAAEQFRRDGESPAAIGGLVDVLCDWAEILTSLGQPQAAADRAGEAVQVLRRAAMLGEGAVPNPRAARALLVLGIAELRAGSAAATGNIDTVVDMSRRMATDLPFEPNRALLATALNQQSMLARAEGRLEDAAVTGAEAVAIRRGLAEADPEQFTEPLGSSLNTLAAVQYAQQNIKAAVSSAEEACQVLASVVDRGDLSAVANLAAAESNAAAIIGDLPNLDAAVKFGSNAVQRYRWLVNRHPAPAFVPELAEALFVLATCVAGEDRFDAGANLCHAALAVLVGHAGMLSMSDLALIASIVQYYQRFAQLSGTDVDRDLLDAATSAMFGGEG